MILIEAVDGIRGKSSEGHQEGGRQSLEHIWGKFTEIDSLTKGQTYIEAPAHETSQEGYHYASWKVEVLHRSFLLLLGQCGCLHGTSNAYDGNTQQGDSHAQQYRSGQTGQGSLLWEEDIEQDGTHHCTQSGTCSQGNTLSQGHAQVTHGEAKGETAHTPQNTKEDGHADIERVLRRDKFTEAMSLRNSQECAQQRQDQPGKGALHNPITLPTPLLNLVDGHIAA